MFIDVVIPSGNEEEFVKRAELLETKGLIFLYEENDKKNLERVNKIKTPVRLFFGVLNKVNSRYDYIFSTGAREHFENKKFDVVFDLEMQFQKDKHHYRSSGLNQVLSVLAKEKGISIAFNFNEILKGKKREMVIGRMKQNVMLCQKYGVGMFLASFAKKPNEMRAWKDLTSFGVTLGMNKKEAKEASLNRKV